MIVEPGQYRDFSGSASRRLKILQRVSFDGEPPALPSLEHGTCSMQFLTLRENFELNMDTRPLKPAVRGCKHVVTFQHSPEAELEIDEAKYFFKSSELSVVDEEDTIVVDCNYAPHLLCQWLHFSHDIESDLIALIVKARSILDNTTDVVSTFDQRFDFTVFYNLQLSEEQLNDEKLFVAALGALEPTWKKYISHTRLVVPKKIAHYIREFTKKYTHCVYRDTRPAVLELDPDCMKLRYRIENNFWNANHINYDQFHQQMGALPEQKRNALVDLIRFFSQVDLVLPESLLEKVTRELGVNELKLLWADQVGIESVHAEVYGKFFDLTLKGDPKVIQRSSALIPSLVLLNRWLQFFAQPAMPLPISIYGGEIAEGVVLFKGFLLIDMLFRDQHGLLVDSVLSANNSITRDEGTHVEISNLALQFVREVPSPEFRTMLMEWAQGIIFDMFAAIVLDFPSDKLTRPQLFRMARAWGDRILKLLGASVVPYPDNEAVEEQLKRSLGAIFSVNDVAFLEQDPIHYVPTNIDESCAACQM